MEALVPVQNSPGPKLEVSCPWVVTVNKLVGVTQYVIDTTKYDDKIKFLDTTEKYKRLDKALRAFLHIIQDTYVPKTAVLISHANQPIYHYHWTVRKISGDPRRLEIDMAVYYQTSEKNLICSISYAITNKDPIY